MSNLVYKHSLIYLAGRIGPAFVILSTTAILTRLADPSDYAILVLSMATGQIGSSLLFQWLRLTILRNSGDVNYKETVNTVLFFYFVQFTLAICVTTLGAFISQLSNGDYLLWLTCGAILLGQGWFDLAQEMQRSALQPIRYSIVFATRTVLSLAFGVLSLYFFQNGYILVLAISLSYFISPLLFSSGIFSGHRISLGNSERQKKILLYGAPLGIALMFNNVAVFSDRYLVAYFLGTENAGLYGPAMDIGRQTIFMLIQSITLATYPLAVRALNNKGADAARTQMGQNLGLIMLVGVPASAGLIIMRVEIAELLLGPSYQDVASTLFPYIAISNFLMCLNTFYFIQANQLSKDSKGQLIVAITTAISSVLLGCILLPLWEWPGAGLAAILTQLIGLLTAVRISNRVFSLPFPLKHIIKTGFATLGMTTVILGVKPLIPFSNTPTTILLFVIGIIAYGSLAVLLDAGDIKQFFRQRREKI